MPGLPGCYRAALVTMSVACRSRGCGRMVVRGWACEAASCTSGSGIPASSVVVMNACRRLRASTWHRSWWMTWWGVMAARRLLVAWAAVGAVAVTALVIGVLWLANPGHGSPAGHSTAASRQGDQVAAALRRLPRDPPSLVASGARSQVAGRARQAFPPGTTVVPDARSWAPDGLGGGTMLVTVTVPGHAPVRYDVIMVSEAGRWKVLATIRAPAPARQASGGPS